MDIKDSSHDNYGSIKQQTLTFLKFTRLILITLRNKELSWLHIFIFHLLSTLLLTSSFLLQKYYILLIVCGWNWHIHTRAILSRISNWILELLLLFFFDFGRQLPNDNLVYHDILPYSQKTSGSHQKVVSNKRERQLNLLSPRICKRRGILF